MKFEKINENQMRVTLSIKDLEDNSYILENKEINEIKSGITGEVITGSSYDSNSRYEFSKNDTNFILLKQGSGAYALWSENALSDIEKETFVRTYNEVNSGSTKFDGSTTNITIDQITWINGYDTFDLSIIGKNWGSYTFSTDNNSIIITCDKSKLSHLVKGFAKEKVKYQGRKIETSHKTNNDKTAVKISVRKRQSARNTLKQNIYKDIENETID